MPELLYALSSLFIVGCLLVFLAVGNELGYRRGLRHRQATNEDSNAQINTIQASLLGILGLLLAFTFSLSLQRFESRSVALVEEVNAAETAHLRADLLSPPYREPLRSLLREYVRLRVAASERALDDAVEWRVLVDSAASTLRTAWDCAQQAAHSDERPVVSALFIQSLNELIDSFGRRNAALDRHVPELVLFLLFGTFVLTGTLVGYTSGLAGRRAAFATYVLMSLVVLLVFLIVDLDRPRRGLIVVNQKSLTALHAQLQTARPVRGADGVTTGATTSATALAVCGR